MNKITTLALLLLVGCATEIPNNVVMGDAGVASDGGLVFGDSAVLVDTGMVQGTDAGTTADAVAAPSDAGVDAYVVSMADAGTDAYVAPMPDGGYTRGDVVALGVNGTTTCALTSTHELWCWGSPLAATPTRQADAVALEGTCAIAVDGHVFCIGSDFPSSDASIVGPFNGEYVRRADGQVVAGSAHWAAPSAVVELPAANCALLSDGSAHCWDWSPSAFINFVDLGPATDVARAGNTGDTTYRACVVTSSGVRCDTARGTTGSTLLQHGVEVDIAGGRACAVVPTSWSGPDDGGGSSFHPAGIYCTSDTPLVVGTGYYPFNPLPAADAVGRYTNIVGTDLHVGSSHACILSSGAVMCWGNGSMGQLGGASTSSVPVTVF